MKFIVIPVTIQLLLVWQISAFTARGPSRFRNAQIYLSSSDDFMNNYLANAHEEKLKAIAELEKKKNEEIQVSLLLS